MNINYQDERSLTELMVVTVDKPQGGSRKAKLKEEEDKITTLLTRR
jgi:hypothetical protein